MKSKNSIATDYIREKVFKYLVDTGMEVSLAKVEAKNMSKEDLEYIYDNEPYFEENGY